MKKRVLGFQCLEPRNMLASALDYDGDTWVTPVDVMGVIQEINSCEAKPTCAAIPQDALRIITHINLYGMSRTVLATQVTIEPVQLPPIQVHPGDKGVLFAEFNIVANGDVVLRDFDAHTWGNNIGVWPWRIEVQNVSRVSGASGGYNIDARLGEGSTTARLYGDIMKDANAGTGWIYSVDLTMRLEKNIKESTIFRLSSTGPFRDVQVVK